MSDVRDTGEHFFGELVGIPEQSAAATARRVADLTSQLAFLDIEVARYRELLETERIRHSTELARLSLEADTRVDDIRREERRRTETLNHSFRKLLAERQIEFEDALTQAATENATELARDRERHEEILRHERTRREVHLEASRKQTIDELNEAHQQTRQQLRAELQQAVETVERLQAEIDGSANAAQTHEEVAKELRLQVHLSHRRLENAVDAHTARESELEAQVANATQRVDAERQRSAATLAELLERSAAIAAEADKARSDFAAQQAKADHEAAIARRQAQRDYAELAEAADERASRALVREAELEARIAELTARQGSESTTQKS